ncbi:hypothetical protein [Aliarcobacter thereius]|uniref:Highly acidic protein n=1 Tax=Aliarcobacter thereius LMG 24486 TaxID=1032240 RepID=A0A1C7WM33_9BACT|nr:hypothetical protein [Aliarcobacter thereius]OCL92078.1 hypothetical protein AAX25_00808 [Aliarcobacter thereius]OCL94826.1 hypothetical protein AA347_00265 [Aliarcobacter thereius LMG 24486]QBF15299.1 hypothetical protein ATH_0209 [Aliarcobacter thereius LMG 24486]TLS92037.1 hypothetical protein FE244_07910 [Aliarcobacter thereius]
MNIFIYGKDEFKKDIRKILNDSKIDQRLDDVSIMQISDLDDLKEQIASNPDDVFLIDDDKILKKSKFAFIKPKDAIEEEFLLQCGVSELSIDSFSEIPDYIIRKHKRLNQIKEENIIESVSEENIENIIENEETIKEEDLVSNPDDILTEIDNKKDIEFDEDFGLNNIDLDYDSESSIQKSDEELKLEEDLENSKEINTNNNDDLNSFISDDFDIEDFKFDESDFDFKAEDFDISLVNDLLEDNNTEDIENKEADEKTLNNKEEIILKVDNEISEDSFLYDDIDELNDFNFVNTDNQKDEEKELEVPYLGDIEKSIEESLEDESIEEFVNLKEGIKIQKEDANMNDFLNLDEINENDMLDALGLENSSSNSIEKSEIEENTNNEEKDISNSNSIELNASNIEDVTALLTKLLKNKNVELSIKIKE